MDSFNPAFDYDRLGKNYSSQRKTDSRIFAHVANALENASSVLNVGAGAGSYEPVDRYVIAVEPSAAMRVQRAQEGRVPAVIAKADDLPFDDNSFDASLAVLTVHHWQDMKGGLLELRRVTRNQVVIMTFDPDSLDEFWNVHYFAEVVAVEKKRYPTIGFLTKALGGHCEIKKIPVPFDCEDGFQEAYYGRPEAFLNKEVRRFQSAWGFVSEASEQKMVASLAEALQSGAWDRQYGHYRKQHEFAGALRLIIARP